MRILLTGLLVVSAVFAQDAEIRLVRLADGLANPTDLQNAGDGSKRLFAAQQNGVVRIYRDDALLPRPFLDLRGRTRANNECGLLGLAFPPGFADKRYFYADYTDAECKTSYVSRFWLTSDDNVADPNSEQVILQQNQPFENHNGGQIRFGPDGYLYIGFGDGGSGGDPLRNGQKQTTFLGKILRIDTESNLNQYNIPDSNPFSGSADWYPEIWAYGLRNPWRFSFDRVSGDLWVADVGQDRAEEINYQGADSRGGENYGWSVMEGFSCYNPSRNCNTDGLKMPVLEYLHQDGNASVTGGFVYRGKANPSLQATYIYADYSSGRIWGIRLGAPTLDNRLLLASSINPSAFAEDEDGELYILDHSGGVIYRIDSVPAP